MARELIKKHCHQAWHSRTCATIAPASCVPSDRISFVRVALEGDPILATSASAKTVRRFQLREQHRKDAGNMHGADPLKQARPLAVGTAGSKKIAGAAPP